MAPRPLDMLIIGPRLANTLFYASVQGMSSVMTEARRHQLPDSSDRARQKFHW
ncbi:hypothetical protein BDW69DRAFT_79386 [Aspergillus filifer]